MSRLGTAYLRVLQAVGRQLDYGTNIFERDWDVLLVLDGCRVDLLRSLASEIQLIDAVESMRSVGSSSSEWLENTFLDHSETARTIMVTGNTWTDRYLEANAFEALDEVWKYAWDEDLGTVPAGAITDRTIQMAQNHDPDRVIAHYMQPHHPFIPDPLPVDDGLVRNSSHSNPSNPWVAIRTGEITTERVWQAYEANLRYVLEAVETLVENVAGRVAITADHGNLFGEWGLYGHPMHTPVPDLLAVPWATTTGGDRGSYTPDLEPPESLPVSRIYGAETDHDRLEALGYR